MEITHELRQKIRQLLFDTGMTQDELAKQIGITHAAVNRWINKSGKTIKATHAKKLCEILGIDYAAEMYRQSGGAGGISQSVGDNNQGTVTQTADANANAHTLAEIVKAVMASDLPSEQKLSVIDALSKIGIF